MANNSMPFKKRQHPLESVNRKVDLSNDRDKYTATMDRELRKRLKVAVAMKGVQLSTFIEEACAEKLEREGF